MSTAAPRARCLLASLAAATLTAAAALSGAAGCSVSLPEGMYLCADPGRATGCPDGWYCRRGSSAAGELRCYSSPGDSLDAGSARDLDSGADSDPEPAPDAEPPDSMGSPSADDAGAEAAAGDAASLDAVGPDLGALDLGPPDEDSGPPDSGPPDSGPPDSGPPDSGPPDSGPPDSGPPDSGPPDSGPADAGRRRGSVELYGAPGYGWLETPDTSQLSITGDLTVELWASTDSYGTPSYPEHTLLTKWTGGGAMVLPRSYFLTFSWAGGPSAGRIGFAGCADGLIGRFLYSSPTPAMTVGTWHHLAVVYHAASGTVDFYFDGSSLGSAGGAPTSLYDGGARLILGGGDSTVGFEPNFWTGRLAEVRIWNVARSGPDIAAARSATIPPQPGLVGYWPLADGTDVSGFDQHMTATRGATYVSDSPF